MDLNYDDKCVDAFYRFECRFSARAARQGSTACSTPAAYRNHFAYNGGVMVWSFGPDGLANKAIRATQGVNKDNILSWKE